MNYLVAILGVLLALSTAGNAWQYHEHDKIITAEATAQQLNRDTANAAKTCSASVDNLAAAGTAREKRLIGAMANIAPTVAAGQKEALNALAAKPDNPNDLCGSLQRFLSAGIKAEKGGAP